MRKGTKLYSILHFKCPYCQEGAFFKDNNPYRFSTVGDVLEACPVCKRRYEREPGFFYGGLYVAYALGVAMFVTAYFATALIHPQASTEVYIGVVLGSLFVFGPVLYALSKIIWANIFFTYVGR